MTKGKVATLFGLLLWAPFAALLSAQRNVQPFPKEVRLAKTVYIVNSTHNEAVEQGAIEALKRWSRFKVSDDPDNADIVLTFEKRASTADRVSKARNRMASPTPASP